MKYIASTNFFSLSHIPMPTVCVGS